jgi:hypothetical protein
MTEYDKVQIKSQYDAERTKAQHLNSIKADLLQHPSFNRKHYTSWTCVTYTSKCGITFDVYLDELKANRVKTLRANKTGHSVAKGLIGDFVGGKARGRKFSFKTTQDLIFKLEKLTPTLKFF